MILRKEIISDDDYEIQGEEVRKNIDTLLERINKIRKAYGQPMRVTSGFRSKEKHLEIYAKKGITSEKKIPMRSKHLSGEAIDILDNGRFLQNWIMENLDFVEKVGLWMESFEHTSNWVHFQIVPPKSGKRFFIP